MPKLDTGMPKDNTAVITPYSSTKSIHTAMMDNLTACLIQNSRMPIQDTGIQTSNTAILGQYKHIMDTPMAMMENTQISKHNAPHCRN